MDERLIVTASPHITAAATTRKMMGTVVLALMPCVLASAIIFGMRALVLEIVTTAACVLFEYLYTRLMKKPNPVGDLSAVVTGLILALNFPVSLPLWIGVVGAFVAIVITKQLFGGLGMNFANPALVGRIVLFTGFAARMTSWVYPDSAVGQLSSATPLQVPDLSQVDLIDLFLGNHGGVLGETCILACLIGFVILVATKVISPAIPVAYVGTVFVCFLLAYNGLHFTSDGLHFALAEIMAGGLMFGAVFMATDYVTSPFTLKGKIVYGVFIGIVTFAIRYFGSMAEGVSYSILLGNLVTPYINDLTHQTPLGYVKPAKKAKEG